ncbi:hypothetical protein O181_057127 [Austropuccinia psidii MF-1]|uniref:Uncharacterized protein n=1 Tax=Austropuccinia psidii MF-1 TaxID=1389203 RepID=A0A9Q3EH62_9BASI|nr:hypothetical protein [Austropuccinia psidii MF-1]
MTESVTIDQPHFQSHNEPNNHDPPCTQSLGKLINLVEPPTQDTANIRKKFIPKKHFIYQSFKDWLSRFLQKAVIMEIVQQHQQSQKSEGSLNCDIWDGLVWRHFTGTRKINDPPFIPIFLVHWPFQFMWTGLMHMEAQATWPELDLSF